MIRVEGRPSVRQVLNKGLAQLWAVTLYVNIFYFTVRQSRSTKMLSRARPRPSMLILTGVNSQAIGAAYSAVIDAIKGNALARCRLVGLDQLHDLLTRTR